MSERAEELLERRLSDHRAAVREFIEKAAALSPAQWLTPRAAGKWTPAQETRHIMLAYDAFRRDLEGLTTVRLRGTPLRRQIWRWIGLTFILWRNRIPVAVKAPREARPESESTAPDELLPALQRCADAFDAELAHTWRTEPRRRVTHPMFGALSLDHAIRLLSVHTRHHAAFLPMRTQLKETT